MVTARPTKSGLLAGAALALLLLSVVIFASRNTTAGADTNPSSGGTLIAKAAEDPTIPTDSTGQDPTTTLSGIVQGTVINLHVKTDANMLNGINIVRVCRPGLTNITASAQLNPSNGACIGNPFVSSGPDADQPNNGGMVASDFATKSMADTSIKVGTGTAHWNSNAGPQTLTCDSANPCALWMDINVNAALDTSGHVFKHWELTYAAAGTTTTQPTTTQPTTTQPTTTQPTTTQPTTTQPTTTQPTTTQPTTTQPTTTQPTTTTQATTTTAPGSTTSSTTPAAGVTLSTTATDPGGQVGLVSDGWAVNTPVDVTLHSDPVDLGTFNADANGNLSVTVTIPADTPVGDHYIELIGTGATTGGTRSVRANIAVGTTTGGSGETSTSAGSAVVSGSSLPATGSDSERLLFSGASLAGAGALLVLAARTRRRAHQR